MDIIEIEIAPITRTVLLSQALIWVKQVKLFEKVSRYIAK